MQQEVMCVISTLGSVNIKALSEPSPTQSLMIGTLLASKSQDRPQLIPYLDRTGSLKCNGETLFTELQATKRLAGFS